MKISKLSNEKEISGYLHCAVCMREKPAGISMQEWAMLEIGLTGPGLQVWCRRHDCNVVHIDFQGQSHPANDTRKI